MHSHSGDSGEIPLGIFIEIHGMSNDIDRAFYYNQYPLNNPKHASSYYMFIKYTFALIKAIEIGGGGAVRSHSRWQNILEFWLWMRNSADVRVSGFALRAMQITIVLTGPARLFINR